MPDPSPIYQTDLGPAIYAGPDQPVPTSQALNTLYGLTGIPDIRSAYQAASRGEYLPALGQGAAGIAALGSTFFPPAREAEAAAEALPRLGNISGLNLSRQGVDVYHGTGATFDKFSDEFIGTGEGAQVRGMGHYMGQAKGTAESYIPPGSGPEPHLGDTPIDQLTFEQFKVPNLIAREHASSALWNASFYEPEKNDWLQHALDYLGKQIGDATQGLYTARSGSDYEAFQKSQVDNFKAAWNWILDNKEDLNLKDVRSGHLLQVKVIPDHERFLDLDKTVAEQSPWVRNRVLPLLDDMGLQDISNPALENFYTGDHIYHAISKKIGELNEQTSRLQGNFAWPGREERKEAEAQASAMLDRAGIPGNTFLDQFSRGMPETSLQYVGKDPFPDALTEDWIKSGKYSSVEHMIDRLNRIKDPNHPPSNEHWNSIIDWVNDHRADFTTAPTDRTYNYVVFHPDNLEIQTRDGIPLVPVEGNPFAQQEVLRRALDEPY